MRVLPPLVLAALLARSATAEVPVVVTDIQPVHSLASQVMGALGSPVLLLDQGGDPHAFQLRPSQARALAGADLVFWIGPELTPWLDRALKATAPRHAAVALLPLSAVTHGYGEGAEDHAGDHAEDHAHDGHDNGHDEAHEDGHAHGDTDPHAWLDPANARAWLDVIAARLAEADPDNAAAYAANAAGAKAALDALDAELRATLAPVADRPVYVFHDAYRYLDEAFGLAITGTIAEGDAADPGAQRLAAIRAALEAGGAACIFAEANHDPAYAETLAEGTGIATGTLDPEGSTLPPGPDHYAAMMRALAAEFARCAGGAG